MRTTSVALLPVLMAVAQAQSRSAPEFAVPLSSTAESKQVRTLDDGTHITTGSKAYSFRDSMGRTRFEHVQVSPEDSKEAVRFVSVHDPVAGVDLQWYVVPANEGERYYKRTVLTATIAVPVPQVQTAQYPPAMSFTQHQHAKMQVENLGTRSVAGEVCECTRTTATWPVASAGNDQPITEVHERCISSYLGQVLSETNTDPRFGVQTTMTTSLVRGEPDPALFQPPAGYVELPAAAGKP